MMKTMKRVGALLLVVAMVLALGVSSFAATSSSNYEGDYTITIQNATVGKDYSAYKILDATYDGEDAVAYTIDANSPWLYLIMDASNLNADNYDAGGSVKDDATVLFTLQAVYKAGSTTEVDYYTVTAADGADVVDSKTGTAPIIDYLESVINIITEDDPDVDGNSVSTGLAYIQTGVDVNGNATYALLIPADCTSSSYMDDEETMTYGQYAESLSESLEINITDYIPAETTVTATRTNVELKVNGAGYYFVTTTTGSTVSITTTDPNATIIDKNIIPGGSTPPPGGDEPGDGTPGLSKYIEVSADDENEDHKLKEEDQNANGLTDETEWDYAMGDVFQFVINSDVPLFADSNKEYGSGSENGDESTAVNNAERVYEYVFTDEMSDGISIWIDPENYDEYVTVYAEYTYTDGDGNTVYVYSNDGGSTYVDGNCRKVEIPSSATPDTTGYSYTCLTDAGINAWITLTDGEYNKYNKFTDYVYNYYLCLTDFVAVCYGEDYGNDGLYYTKEVADLTKDDKVAYYAASGFKLVYYTYNTVTYDETLESWLNNEGHKDSSGNVYTSIDELPEEAYEEAWAAAYTNNGNPYPTTAEITINYDAVVTDVAVYDNTNTVTMDYYVTSWDVYPPYDYPDIPEEPDDDNPDEPGKTPGTHSGQQVKNDVFTWELQIDKVADDGKTALEGAVFTLEGDTLDRVKVTTYTYTLVSEVEKMADAEKAAYDINQNYYLLADGETFVTDAPTESNSSKYAEENYGPYYRKSDYTMEYEDTDSTNSFYAIGTTDGNGQLIFAGLKEGYYTLTEIKAPDGYNIIDPIYFTVTWYDAGEYLVSEGTYNTDPLFVITFYEDAEYKTVATDDEGNKLIESFVADTPSDLSSNATYDLTVVDIPGTLLPGTGGIGTTIFYIIGGCLVVGAVVVLVTRKRVGKEEKA